VGIIGFAVDITYRKEAQDILAQSEEEYRTLVNNVNIGVYRTTPDKEGRFLKANPAMVKMFGYASEEEIMQHKVIELYEDPGRRLQLLRKMEQNGFVKNEEMRFKKKDGTPLWVAVTAKMHFSLEGKPQWLDGVIEDITERKQIEKEIKESEEKFRTLFDSAKDGILVADIETKQFIMSNKMVCKMLGYNEEEMKCLSVKDIHPRKDLPYILEQFEKLAQEEIKIAPDLPVQRKDGSIFYADITATLITLDGKKYLMGSFRDITERKRAEGELDALNKELLKSNKRLRQLSLRDPQTGLYNHRYLEEVIEAEFHRAKRYVHPLSVMMLDVDYFKSINDVYGHHFGDLILKQLARQLKRLVRQYDIVTRFGGEEFMILSPGIDRSGALTLGRRLLDAVNLYNFGDEKHTVKIKLSIAVASYPEDKIIKGIDLVMLTDQILDKVKEYGGNNVYSSLDIHKKALPSPKSLKVNGNIRFLKDQIDKLTKKTNQSLIEAVFAFAKTIELKDHFTGEHVERTVQYATELARALDLPEEEIERIKQAAILHDLGKIGISEKILVKKLKLTRQELEEVKKHPQIGVDIIRPIKFLHNIIPLILYHHERWDGKGYPNGLKGEEIPIGARIIALADVYQALTSNRPYRKAYSEREAIKIIKKGSGTQFDPRMATKFVQILQKKK
jgi:diguanylate cyclase (GGDEF)-like protein/PAS domain S-box-containing protein